MSATITTSLSDRQSAYIEAFYGVIIAFAGNQLTLDAPTKDTHIKLYANCVEWVWENSARFNIVLKDEFESRKALLDDYFSVEPIDENMLKELRDLFPKESLNNEVELKKVYACWEQCKRDCKNSYAPSYLRSKKQRMNGYQSGTYDDSKSLLDILEKEVCDGITDNFKKAMNSIKNEMKKPGKSHKTEEEQKEYLLTQEKENI